MPDAFEEGNLVNISKTITVYISIKPGVTENILLRATCNFKEVTAYQVLFHEFHNVFAWSYEEMLGMDPNIIEHHIDTLLYVPHVR